MIGIYKKYNGVCRIIAIMLILFTMAGLFVGCDGTDKADGSGDSTVSSDAGKDTGSSERPKETDGILNIGPSSSMLQNSVTNKPEETHDSSGQSTSKPTVTPGQAGSSTAKPDKPESQKIVFDKMPSLKIKTAGNAAVTSTSVYVNCTVSSDKAPAECSFTDSPAEIKVRGNSTAGAAKKPYRIKFTTKQAMFGLNDSAKCRSWCLMADYFDHSMLRNYTAFNLGRTLLGDNSFASDAMHVEVYLNGEYQGVYLLCEQSQVHKKRVNIYEKQDNETSLELGYLLIGQGGRTDEEDSVVITLDREITDLNGTVMNLGGMNFSISGGPYTDAQKKYIEKFASNALKIVWSAIYEKQYYSLNSNGDMVKKTSFSGTSTEQKQRETIGAVMNIESAVSMYILDEIVKNFDAGTFNMYMDLGPQGDRRITFGPPWDFDFAMGNTRYASTYSSQDVYAANFTYSDGYRTNFLFAMLYNLSWFRTDVSKVWCEKYDAMMADIKDIKTVTAFGKAQFESNYDRWPTLGTSTMGHQSDDVLKFGTHKNASDYLYNWLVKRMAYIDSYWRNGVFKEPEKVTSEMSTLDFSKSSTANFFSKIRRCNKTQQSDSMKFTVTDNDPYFYVDYTKSSQRLSASANKKISITYMAPAPKTNSRSNYMCEIFLIAGSATDAEAGKSVTFEYTADGKYHTKVIDLSSVPFWNGNVNGVRIDFFVDCAVGDVFYMKELKIY